MTIQRRNKSGWQNHSMAVILCLQTIYFWFEIPQFNMHKTLFFTNFHPPVLCFFLISCLWGLTNYNLYHYQPVMSLQSNLKPFLLSANVSSRFSANYGTLLHPSYSYPVLRISSIFFIHHHHSHHRRVSLYNSQLCHLHVMWWCFDGISLSYCAKKILPFLQYIWPSFCSWLLMQVWLSGLVLRFILFCVTISHKVLELNIY